MPSRLRFLMFAWALGLSTLASVAWAEGPVTDNQREDSRKADNRRERFERLPPEQQVRYLRSLPPDMRRDLGSQLSPETRARIRDQILEERMQRLERQAERQAERRGAGEAPARRLNDEERQQLREQINEAHRKRGEGPPQQKR